MSKEIKINIGKILDEAENIDQKELNQVLDIANCIYNYLDIPVVVLNNKQIKSNLLIVAMYLVGKQIGKAVSDK